MEATDLYIRAKEGSGFLQPTPVSVANTRLKTWVYALRTLFGVKGQTMGTSVECHDIATKYLLGCLSLSGALVSLVVPREHGRSRAEPAGQYVSDPIRPLPTNEKSLVDWLVLQVRRRQHYTGHWGNQGETLNKNRESKRTGFKAEFKNSDSIHGLHPRGELQ